MSTRVKMIDSSWISSGSASRSRVDTGIQLSPPFKHPQDLYKGHSCGFIYNRRFGRPPQNRSVHLLHGTFLKVQSVRRLIGELPQSALSMLKIEHGDEITCRLKRSNRVAPSKLVARPDSVYAMNYYEQRNGEQRKS